jgi:hypothetical protein
MPIFRIACALGLLFVFAPDKTSEALRNLFGMAQDIRADLPGHVPLSADQVLAACHLNPETCMQMAKTAAKSR